MFASNTAPRDPRKTAGREPGFRSPDRASPERAAARAPLEARAARFQAEADALVDRLLAPARARQGQAVELTVVLQSQGGATGRLVLLHDGVQLGDDIPLALDGGTHVERVTVDLQGSGPQQFEAVFEAAANQNFSLRATIGAIVAHPEFGRK